MMLPDPLFLPILLSLKNEKVEWKNEVKREDFLDVSVSVAVVVVVRMKNQKDMKWTKFFFFFTVETFNFEAKQVLGIEKRFDLKS